MKFETFAPLAGIPHAFTFRDSADDTRDDSFQDQVVRALGFDRYAAAEQTHGNGVALVDHPGVFPGVDALITRQRGLPLVIRCADCAPVFLVAPDAVALIHSGKKGTMANIVGQTLKHIKADFALIGPSIGPCHYEMDLWAGIERQLLDAGVKEIHNPRLCTACHLDRYYSYRAEKGQTGRMFAVLSL